MLFFCTYCIIVLQQCKSVAKYSRSQEQTGGRHVGRKKRIYTGFVTLEDEDGNEQVFELLDVLEYEDNTYYALVPYYGDDEDALAQDDGEFVILKTEEVNGEEMLVSIEEDAEYETIGNKFLDRLNEIYGDEDDEDEDDDVIFE